MEIFWGDFLDTPFLIKLIVTGQSGEVRANSNTKVFTV